MCMYIVLCVCVSRVAKGFPNDHTNIIPTHKTTTDLFLETLVVDPVHAPLHVALLYSDMEVLTEFHLSNYDAGANVYVCVMSVVEVCTSLLARLCVPVDIGGPSHLPPP